LPNNWVFQHPVNPVNSHRELTMVPGRRQTAMRSE
jgi:hypothetical protein